MALFLALHDLVGPKALGAALNALDARGDVLRVNAVRYYDFARLKKALLDAAKDDRTRRALKQIMP